MKYVIHKYLLHALGRTEVRIPVGATPLYIERDSRENRPALWVREPASTAEHRHHMRKTYLSIFTGASFELPSDHLPPRFSLVRLDDGIIVHVCEVEP